MYSHQSFAEERLLRPRARSEGSYKIGSVCLSFCPPFRLFISFLEIGSFFKFFFETLHDVRGPYIVVCDSWIFLEKNPHRAKMVKKWPKNMVFGLFKKMTLLALSVICVKWKFLWFINILQKLYAWEKSSSQVIDKNGSPPVRFLYSLIISISLID